MSTLSWATCRVAEGMRASEGCSTDTAGHMHQLGEAAGKGKLVSQKPHL